MKKSVLLASFIIVMGVQCVQSQVTLDRISMSEGKGAMTSGLDFVLSFSGQNDRLYALQANNERINVRFGKRFGDFTALATLGAFRNVPWAGPMFSYSKFGFTLFSWSDRKSVV